jgi:DNA-binding MarR family transcriptional regulator
MIQDSQPPEGLFSFDMLAYGEYFVRRIKHVLRASAQLTSTQYCILQDVKRNNPDVEHPSQPAEPGIKTLALKLSLTEAAIAIAIDGLVRAGLLRKQPAEDRRARWLSLTQAGQRRLQNADLFLGELIKGVIGSVDPNDFRWIIKTAIRTLSSKQHLRVDTAETRIDLTYIEGMLLIYGLLDSTAGRFGLNFTKTSILCCIDTQGGRNGLSKAAIAQLTLLPYNNVYQLAAHLLADGLLVEPTQHMAGERGRLYAAQAGAGRREGGRVALSASGRALYKQVLAALVQTMVESRSARGAQDFATLRRLCRLLAEQERQRFI